MGLPQWVATGLMGALTLALAACGAGGDAGVAETPVGSTESIASVDTASVKYALTVTDVAGDQPSVAPTFHAAPVILDAPDAADSIDPATSAQHAPHEQRVQQELSGLSSRGLTREQMDEVLQDGIIPTRSAAYGANSTNGEDAAPLATGTLVATYTPAQIRAAYGLPALPAPGASMTSAQAAQLGAGQTLYIVDAYHDPNAATELAAFNQNFGLPGCTSVQIAATATLPLTTAPTSGCTFAVVYSTAAGRVSATAPAYDSGWATEIALDVQWAHATAPLARIVLIEAPDASVGSLVGAISLANSMGPGVVSMSFGAAEGAWSANYESAFSGTNMTYVAASGDSGVGVQWPSVSPRVVAVGGTTLRWSGSGTRSEAVWSGTGGGISQYTALPSYQTSAVPGLGNWRYRAASDVSFNGDPTTGQYVAVITPGTTQARWISAGGTSLSAPQWAGLLAMANAQRLLAARPLLGDPHALIYGIAAQSAPYSANFLDISQGLHGTCAACYATPGYDAPSGIGSPNAATLLGTLSQNVASSAPVVTGASVSGFVGVPLAFTVSAVNANPMMLSLVNAPPGMTISATGVVTWSAPLAGTYAVTVRAADTRTGLSGQGLYSITIKASQPPVIGGATITSTAGAALTYAVGTSGASGANTLAFSLTGAPSGMTISSNGVIGWASPVAGTYTLTVTARDSVTGLSGFATLTFKITPPAPPVVTSQTVSGIAGRALSFSVPVSAANAVTYSLSGAPAGMAISSTGVLSWTSPLAGKYAVTVTAKDSRTGLTGSAVCNLTIAAPGPVIAAAAMTGVAGKSLSGAIAISDATSNSLSVTISGVPAGMKFVVSGLTFQVTWLSPVTGSYALNVRVVDGNGAAASAVIPVTITAR